MSEQTPLGERVGENTPYLIDPDTAWLVMLNGQSFDSGARLLPDERQAIAAGAVRLGVRLPQEVSANLPGTSAIADALRSGQPCLPMLQVAAEALEGNGPQVGKTTAGVVVGASLLADGVMSLVSKALNTHYPVAAKVAGGIGNIAGAPGAAAKALATRSQERVAGAASIFVRETYGQHLYNAADLAPYMWASMLNRLSDMKNVPDYVLVKLAARYMTSYLAAPVSRSSSRVPRSLQGMHANLVATAPLLERFAQLSPETSLDERSQEAQGLLAGLVRNAAKSFSAEEAKARAKRRAELEKPPSLSKRPSGEALENLHVSSKTYNSLALLPANELRGRLRASFLDVIEAEQQPSAELYEELAVAWAAVCERVSLCNGEQEGFADLVSAMHPLVASHLEQYLSTQTEQLAKGAASVAVVRLVANRLYPQKGLWPTLNIDYTLKEALDTAAFNWFDQPPKPYPEGVRLPTREAYVAVLSGLSLTEDDAPTIVDLERIQRLAWSLADDARAERGLCLEVLDMIDVAQQLVGCRPEDF